MAKVFIGVGHGGSDPGACANGLREADVNLTMALALRDELQRHGVTVGISRTRDENDRLTDEIRECNAFAPDLAVEVHNNSGGGDGFEVFVYPGSSKSRELAQAIETEIKAIGQNSRGVKTSTTLGWVREVKTPAVLCEGFFLDSADRAIGNTADKQRAFGVAYARGVLRVLGIPYRATEGALEPKQLRMMIGGVEYAVEAVEIGGNNYVKLRGLEQAGYDVTYDAARGLPGLLAPQTRVAASEQPDVQAAIETVQTRAGLAEETVAYLLRYEHGDELLRKLAAGMR